MGLIEKFCPFCGCFWVNYLQIMAILVNILGVITCLFTVKYENIAVEELNPLGQGLKR